MPNKISPCACLLLVSALCAISFAQEITEVPVCDEFKNPNLAQKIKKGSIEELNVFDAGPGSYAASQGLATSFLENKAKAPRRPADTPPAEYEKVGAWEEAATKYELHTCRFCPKRAFDRSTASAWCEGVKGNGAGQILLVPLWKRGAREIEIRPGYAKSKSLFLANNRPRKIRAYLLAADKIKVHQYGDLLSGVKVVARREVTLADENKFQKIEFEDVPSNSESFRLVAIEILSVYKGRRYPDTCISEVRATR